MKFQKLVLSTLVPVALLVINTNYLFAGEDKFACELTRTAVAGVQVQDSAYNEAGAEVKISTDEFEIDATHSPGGLFFVANDKAAKLRVAFLGSQMGADFSGGRVSLPNLQVGCKKNPKGAPDWNSIPKRPQLPDYIACTLDELVYEKGAIKELKKGVITKRASSLSFGRPQSINAENDELAIKIELNNFDPMNGLRIKIHNKKSGLEGSYVGSAKAFQTSFLFAYTEGDREASAISYRLGCLYTDDPKVLEAK